jgi:hypothetical protein
MSNRVWTKARFGETMTQIDNWLDEAHIHAILCSQATMDKVIGEPATTKIMSRLARFAIDEWDYTVTRREGGWLFTWVSGISSLELDQFVPEEFVPEKSEPEESELEEFLPEESEPTESEPTES